VPFVLIRFNVDQAAGSAPIITSIKDIAGLMIYFVFVTTFFGAYDVGLFGKSPPLLVLVGGFF
jgi:hypothetical protein